MQWGQRLRPKINAEGRFPGDGVQILVLKHALFICVVAGGGGRERGWLEPSAWCSQVPMNDDKVLKVFITTGLCFAF